ncbi:hypothetical protein RI054_04g21040 [Pseudoscourfieldia marina]
MSEVVNAVGASDGMLSGTVNRTALKSSSRPPPPPWLSLSGGVRKRITSESYTNALLTPRSLEAVILDLTIRVGHCVGTGDVLVDKRNLSYVVHRDASEFGAGLDIAIRSMLVGEQADVMIDAPVAPGGGLRNHHAQIKLISVDNVVDICSGTARRRRSAPVGLHSTTKTSQKEPTTSTSTFTVRTQRINTSLWETPEAIPEEGQENDVRTFDVPLARGLFPAALEESLVGLEAGDAFLLRVDDNHACLSTDLGDVPEYFQPTPSSPAVWHVTVTGVENVDMVKSVANLVDFVVTTLKPVANGVMKRPGEGAEASQRAASLYAAIDALLIGRQRRIRSADYETPAAAAADRRLIDGARAPILSNLALCHRRMERHKLGEQACATCLDVCMRLSDGEGALPAAFVAKVHFRRAQCLAALGETDDALISLDRAKESDPGVASSCASERKKLLHEKARREKEDRARLQGMFAPPPPPTTRSGGVVIQEIAADDDGNKHKHKKSSSVRLYSDEETQPSRDAFPARRDADLSRGLVPVDLDAEYAEIEAEEKREAGMRDMMSKVRGDVRPSMGNPWDRSGKREAKEMNDYYFDQHAQAEAEKEERAAALREQERVRRVAEGTWQTVQMGLNGARLDELL